jgi:hypothetical protein
MVICLSHEAQNWRKLVAIAKESSFLVQSAWTFVGFFLGPKLVMEDDGTGWEIETLVDAALR